MNFEELVEKYNIGDAEAFKIDLFAFFLKSNEIQSKKNQILDMFSELTKQMQEISKSATQKPDLGQFASKASKAYAEDNNIDISGIDGSGQNGKITKSDLMKISKPVKKNANKKTEEKKQSINHTCNGIKSSGESCDKVGVYEINSLWYCGFHKSQGNVQQEEPTESSDEEVEF